MSRSISLRPGLPEKEMGGLTTSEEKRQERKKTAIARSRSSLLRPGLSEKEIGGLTTSEEKRQERKKTASQEQEHPPET